MTDRNKVLSQMIQALKRQRDELAVKIHLGKAEAKEEWEKIEEKLSHLTARYEPVQKAVGETSENVYEALKLAAEEVKEGFERIWKML